MFKINKIKCKCTDVFTKDEIKHLEEVLNGDLEGYEEETKGIKSPELKKEFVDWKNLSNNILRKCELNEWKTIEEVEKKEKKDMNKLWNKMAKKEKEERLQAEEMSEKWD